MIGGAPQSYHDEIRRKEVREQRRYEIARDVMAAIYGGGQIDSRLPKLICEMSVGAADALLAALEET